MNCGLSPGKRVQCEIPLLPPAPGAAGIAEIAGTLKADVVSRAGALDLGFAELAAGAAGKELGARIVSVQGRQLTLEIAVPAATLGQIAVLDEAGREAKIGSKSIQQKEGGVLSATLTLAAEMPKKGKIVVRRAQRYALAFRLKDLDPVGRPQPGGQPSQRSGGGTP